MEDLKPGREMDRKVTTALGVEKCDDDNIGMGWYIGGRWSPTAFRPFSTDPTAMLELLDFLKRDGWTILVATSEEGGTDCVLRCTADARGAFSSVTEGVTHAFGEAICIAALKALEAYPNE